MNTINLSGHLITPSKIICIGRNYVDHINELGNEIPADMVIFLKPNSAIGRNKIRSTHAGEPLHYETEIVYMIEGGQVAAVGLGLDLTKRMLQSNLKAKGLPWERAKAFNGSAVFSKFVQLPNPTGTLRLKLFVDGQLRQSGGTQQMISCPYDILTEVRTFLTLNDGDLIMTGTPKGVGQIQPGSSYRAQLLLGDDCLVEQTWLAI